MYKQSETSFKKMWNTYESFKKMRNTYRYELTNFISESLLHISSRTKRLSFGDFRKWNTIEVHYKDPSVFIFLWINFVAWKSNSVPTSIRLKLQLTNLALHSWHGSRNIAKQNAKKSDLWGYLNALWGQFWLPRAVKYFYTS